MIPRRVCLRGFLCYREEQEIDFADSTLWMLAGLNGSGKSAIFDAVTYALFGHHRGGSQHAAELINKDSDGLAVEFDFGLDGEHCRIRRTLKKNARGSTSATQQILRFHSSGTEGRPGKWEPELDTSRKVEFDAWVRERIGLTYDTFTSSVLLQGRAEKLLDSSPRGRFEVLAGIVDLERYARLHGQADERRRELKARHEALQHQLIALLDVDPMELIAADARVTSANENRTAAQAEVERWQVAEFRAAQWSDLQAKATALHQRWQQAQSLLVEATAIERDAERVRDLNAVVPHLETIVKQRGQLAESQRTTERLLADEQIAQENLAVSDHTLGQAVQKRASLQKTIAGEEQRQRDLSAERLRRLSGVLEQIKILEVQQREFERQQNELVLLPADVEGTLTRAQREYDEVAVIAQVVPQLARLAQTRDDLRLARERERQASLVEQTVKARGEQLTAELKALEPQIEARTIERVRADQESTAARTLLRQASEEVQAFRQLEGAQVCRQCGQLLTETHFVRELTKRLEDVQTTESRVHATTAVQKAAQQAEQELRAQATVRERERQDKREEYRDVRRQMEQARSECDRFVRDCAAGYRELPEPFRARVAPTPPGDWLTTTYPTLADLDAGRTESTRLESIRQQVRQARDQHLRWTTLRGQVEALRQAVRALEADLPGDPQELRQEHVRCEAEDQAITGQLKAARAESKVVQDELDRLGKDREQINRKLSNIAGQLQSEAVTRKHCQASLDTAFAALPVGWKAHAERAKLSELHGWKGERDQLAREGVEKRVEDLRQVRAGLESLRQSKADLDRDLESSPEDARRPLAEVRAGLLTAKEHVAAADEAVRQARQDKALLEDRQTQRGGVLQQALVVDRDHTRQSLLAQLLGKDRLQLYLVRQAERQIVDHANAVLDRLSGGQLYLRLRGSDEGEGSDKALELEAYNRTTGGTAINVAFLSGSQRFRVAVSLALGIGQYASRQHRPIESVIIDEGFGCLDRNGRQVMIQELQNLRGHLHCILLVSHQEEFADAFADGYRFELEDGTTRATRIQR